MSYEELDYLEAMKLIERATQDIHAVARRKSIFYGTMARCEHPSYKVSVWNGLGAIESSVPHRDLVERGPAYERFVTDLAANVASKLTVTG